MLSMHRWSRGGESHFLTVKVSFRRNSGQFSFNRGTFGLWLDNDLYRGRSTACDTYNSEMLSSSEDFLCVGVEVWTFA